MRKTRTRATALTAFAVAVAGSVAGAAEAPHNLRAYPGQQYESLIQSSAAQASTAQVPHHSANAADRFRYWNQIAIDSSGLDHTPVQPGENRIAGHQPGPGRAARAMAIVHIAMADSVASIRGGFRRYSPIPNAPAGSSVDTAIATAAHNTLVAMFPPTPSLGALLPDDLIDAPGTRPGEGEGRPGGAVASVAILAPRKRRIGARRAALGADISRVWNPASGDRTRQPAAGRPRRPLGRGQAVRAGFGRPVPHSALSGH